MCQSPIDRISNWFQNWIPYWWLEVSEGHFCHIFKGNNPGDSRGCDHLHFLGGDGDFTLHLALGSQSHFSLVQVTRLLLLQLTAVLNSSCYDWFFFSFEEIHRILSGYCNQLYLLINQRPYPNPNPRVILTGQYILVLPGDWFSLLVDVLETYCVFKWHSTSK